MKKNEEIELLEITQQFYKVVGSLKKKIWNF